MQGLTKEKARQLDDLLIEIHNAKAKGDLLNVMEVSKSMDSLKDKDPNYIQGLLYFLRQLPANVPELFRGEYYLAVAHTNLYQFLATGGFKKIRKDTIRKRIINNAAFWSIFILSGIAAYYSLVTYEFPKHQKGKVGKSGQPPLRLPSIEHKDSLGSLKQNPKTDSNSKGRDSAFRKTPRG
jgi:hypothetical protein